MKTASIIKIAIVTLIIQSAQAQETKKETTPAEIKIFNRKLCKSF